MEATIIVGVIFAVIIFIALKKTRKDIKNNKCAGCSGCSNPKNCHL